MTKEYFKELAAYNTWANDVVCQWMEQLSDEQWKREIVSSFPSIYETVLHVAASGKVWVERLQKFTNFEFLNQTFNGSKPELVSIWKETSLALQKFIEAMPEHQFTEKLLYKNIKGIEYNEPYYQLLAHIINHNTYHRGQLVTMLRQVGYTHVSSMDMTTYFRAQNL